MKEKKTTTKTTKSCLLCSKKPIRIRFFPFFSSKHNFPKIFCHRLKRAFLPKKYIGEIGKQRKWGKGNKKSQKAGHRATRIILREEKEILAETFFSFFLFLLTDFLFFSFFLSPFFSSPLLPSRPWIRRSLEEKVHLFYNWGQDKKQNKFSWRRKKERKFLSFF